MITKQTAKICDLVQKVMGDDIDKLSLIGALLMKSDPLILRALIKSTIATMVESNKLIIVERDT